jgi:DNA-directed RNA polymerase specialized sigma24 family protein
MSTSNLPAEPELVVQSRKAAYCARRRLDRPELTTQDMEDMIQAAALAYWKHHRQGRSPAFCFVCARTAAEKHFFRQILGGNPRNPLSLDVAMNDGGDPPHEWLPSLVPANDPTLRLDWLSDEVLEGVLFEARRAAGFSKHQMTRYWDTLQADKRIIRLAARGHTNASIAQQMATTEGTIRNRRQRIRRLLRSLLPPEATLVEYSRNGGNQSRAREIQLTYPGGCKPETVS